MRHILGPKIGEVWDKLMEQTFESSTNKEKK